MTKVKTSRGESPYAGDLKNPIEIWKYDRAVVGERAAALDADNEAHIFAERMRKLQLLVKHFQLDDSKPTVFTLLAYRLAIEHVPGFRAEISKKRNSDQKVYEVADLVEAIKMLGLATSDIDACQELAKIQHQIKEESAGKTSPRQLTESEAFKRGRTLQNLLPKGRKLTKKNPFKS